MKSDFDLGIRSKKEILESIPERPHVPAVGNKQKLEKFTRKAEIKKQTQISSKSNAASKIPKKQIKVIAPAAKIEPPDNFKKNI